MTRLAQLGKPREYIGLLTQPPPTKRKPRFLQTTYFFSSILPTRNTICDSRYRDSIGGLFRSKRNGIQRIPTRLLKASTATTLVQISWHYSIVHSGLGSTLLFALPITKY